MPRTTKRGGNRKANRGSFRPVIVAGPDPRRHIFTREERSRGGKTTARRYLCTGRWYPDWYDRCDRKVRTETGEFYDAEEKDGCRDGDIPF